VQRLAHSLPRSSSPSSATAGGGSAGGGSSQGGGQSSAPAAAPKHYDAKDASNDGEVQKMIDQSKQSGGKA
jgi:hypothetical protein